MKYKISRIKLVAIVGIILFGFNSLQTYAYSEYSKLSTDSIVQFKMTSNKIHDYKVSYDIYNTMGYNTIEGITVDSISNTDMYIVYFNKDNKNIFTTIIPKINSNKSNVDNFTNYYYLSELPIANRDIEDAVILSNNSYLVKLSTDKYSKIIRDLFDKDKYVYSIVHNTNDNIKCSCYLFSDKDISELEQYMNDMQFDYIINPKYEYYNDTAFDSFITE